MAYNTIKIKTYSNNIEELKATAVAITPGMLVERTSANLVQAHSSAGGKVIPMFATEDDLQGNGITDNYAVSTQVQCIIPYRGDVIYALLANGETAVIGSYLVSNGDGYLQVYATESNDAAIVGRALEAVDMSDSSGADPSGRIAIEII